MNKQTITTAIDECIEAFDLQYPKEKSGEARELIVLYTELLRELRILVVQDSVMSNIMLLRAMHDIGMSSYRVFENTPLEGAISNLYASLYNGIPSFKNLTPLRYKIKKEDII